MTPEALRSLREKMGVSQVELAERINPVLDRRYRGQTISAWENGDRPIPANVEAFLDQLELEMAVDGFLPPAPDAHPSPGGGEDQPPRDLFDPEAQRPLSGSNVYARVCQELWEMIAMAVGMTGAILGNERLQADGAIIDADKVALGRAYGKLAETNDTFRRMIVGATSGGAWLEVGLVTGQTAAKIWQNHQSVKVQDGRVVHLSPPDAQPDPSRFSAS